MDEHTDAATEQVEPGLDWRAATMPALAIVAAGLVVASAVMPWYARQIGPVGVDPSISGLEAGTFAVIAVALGAFSVVAAALLALDAAGAVAIEPPIALLMSWVTVGASTAATALVAYKLVFVPEPTSFFTRDTGVWLAFFGAAACACLIGLQTPERARAAGRNPTPIPRSPSRRAARRGPA